MTEKTRTCGTCAWWTEYPVQAASADSAIEGVCHWDPAVCPRNSAWWCRHWSETTGWDRFEQMPTELEQQAAEIFQRLRTLTDHQASRIERWLEDYTRKC